MGLWGEARSGRTMPATQQPQFTAAPKAPPSGTFEGQDRLDPC